MALTPKGDASPVPEDFTWPPRQAPDDTGGLSATQQETVRRLIAAAGEVLADVGYEQFTVRSAAATARVAPATAYTYFASKAHLVAEVFWYRLSRLPTESPDVQQPAAERVMAALGGVVRSS